MKELMITALIALALSSTAQAKAKPPQPQTPPPTISGSCTLDKGIWHGNCQIVPPIKIPTTPKPEKVEKSK